MKKRGILLGLCLSMCWGLVAQRPINIDSLRKELIELDKQKPSFSKDTNKVKTLLEMSVYYSSNTDSGFYYIHRTLDFAQRIKWQKGVALAYIDLAVQYSSQGNILKWSENVKKAFAIALKINDISLQSSCYGQFAAIYATQGNYPLAIKYFSLEYQLALKSKDYYIASNALNNVAHCWLNLGNKTKALTILKNSLALAKQHNQKLVEAMCLQNIGYILKDSIGFEKQAIGYMERSDELFKMLNRPLFLAEGVATIGQTYLKKKEYKKALPYIWEALDTYKKYHWATRTEESENFDANLYEIYKGLNQPSKALFHLEKYNALLDSLLKSEIKAQRDIVKVQEEKEKQQTQINRLKNREIQQELILQKRTQNFLWVGLGMLIFIGAGLLWYNRKLRLKNKDLEDKNEIIREVTHKIQASEITALRAQMNPHFIFNCLNSIQLFTAQNDTDKATDYLAKFSRLIRLVLENSRSEKVTLENELETLQLYIEMEVMRFRGKVKFEINVANQIDQNYVEIPPLLLQPFVENAIWHGLMHKEEGGTVQIDVTQPNENLLHIEITDDGIGREKASEFKSKSATKNKSFGMKVTTERIELINQLYNTSTKVQVIDLKDEKGDAIGTKVIVEIPI
jgi:tetratricopeptide (TPR) repeat protein